MSSFNVSKLRHELINLETHLACASSIKTVKEATTFCNMFEAMEQSCCHTEVGHIPELQTHRTIEHFKELYFPSLVTRTIKVQVEVPVLEGLARVEQIKGYIKKKLKIFNDVKEVI